MVVTKRCSWGTCKNDTRYPDRMVKNRNGDLVSFFHFPGQKRKPEKRTRWISACRRGDSFVCRKDSYICSLHFIGENGPTDEDPDPISATASKERIRQVNCKRKAPKDRVFVKKPCIPLRDEKSAANALLMLSESSSKVEKTEEDDLIAEILLSFASNTDSEVNSRPTVPDLPGDTSYGLEEEKPDLPSAEILHENDAEKSSNLGCQTLVQVSHLNAYSDKMLTNSGELLKLLFLAKVEDPNQTMHYTGMEMDCLDMIFDHIEAKAKNVRFWRGSKRTQKHRMLNTYLKQKYNRMKLSTREQFIFTLIRLRRNTSVVMLANLFGISAGTGSKIFITWILFLSKELECFLQFTTLRDLKGIQRPRTMQSIQNLRAIIDCTEFHIQAPSRPSSQRSTYSQYKSTNTFKLLVSISPIMHFNFVSVLYTGSISDKEIVRDSGFLDQLEPDDVVMADKGFNIQDLLALRQVRLLAPPMMRKNTICATTSTATRRIASIRVHVERMIRKLKGFTILKSALPLTMKPYISALTKVCAALVNLQPKIIKNDED